MGPFALFHQWFSEAKACASIADATAMSLGTATRDGKPSVRTVLLKEADERGFVFYTNCDSRKGTELKANPHAALCFYWAGIDKQVRIEGAVSPVSDAEADAYFVSRERGKQVGAWASLQSQPLESMQALMKRAEAFEKSFEGAPVPRPPHWSGWRLVPDVMEFWQQGQYRLHQRDCYIRHGDHWHHTLLNP